MTPYEIKLMLHFVTGTGPYEGEEPIAKDTIANFLREELLAEGPPNGLLLATTRAHAYVEALTSVPLPTATWSVEFPKLKPYLR